MNTRQYSKPFLVEMYRKMALIRQFEERVKFLFLEGQMPGTIHQYQGQEACAVGVCMALKPDDVIGSTHRPHGHAIAKGVSIHAMMAELFGKTTGCSKGKGGSMHTGDMEKGMIPAIAIVGGNIPVVTGAALAFAMRKEKRVAVSFLGDGATNEGVFHEAVNMGAIWHLPVVYVVENNLYGASTPVGMVIRTETLAERASIYRIPGIRVDGNDPLAVYEAAKEAVDRARSGGGPTLLELMTYRLTGHSRRDPCHYQPSAERQKAKAADPIVRFKTFLLEEGTVSSKELEDAEQEIEGHIEQAVQHALAAPVPEGKDALEDMFVDFP